MTAADLTSIPVLFGGFLLLWALTALRSKFDAALLALAGALSIFLQLRHAPELEVITVARFWPELALAVLGLFMLVRVFLTPLGFLHRLGFLIAGLVVLLPLLAVIGIVLLFAGAFS
ncbi:MAG: hypothetical protein AB7J30_21370 [Hyphomicrobium sp.]|uniref:hypothetical protein n=1 Tax=Hyphomicrobium sp. TaxID=82 RepID=UPI003D0C019C